MRWTFKASCSSLPNTKHIFCKTSCRHLERPEARREKGNSMERVSSSSVRWGRKEHGEQNEEIGCKWWWWWWCQGCPWPSCYVAIFLFVYIYSPVLFFVVSLFVQSWFLSNLPMMCELPPPLLSLLRLQIGELVVLVQNVTDKPCQENIYDKKRYSN